MTKQELNKGLKDGSIVKRVLSGWECYYFIKPMEAGTPEYNALRRLGVKKPKTFILIKEFTTIYDTK